MIIEGKTLILGDNVDTDMLLPGRWLSLDRPEELAAHCLEGLAPVWPEKVRTGRIIVAGKNFGCGSSREHAAIALKAAGIDCVLAESFGFIFYRNAVNLGLAVLEFPRGRVFFQEYDYARINFEDNSVANLTSGKVYPIKSMARMALDVLRAGGLMPYLQKSAG